MESAKLELLITENMKSVFGFSLTRLGDPRKAEELASDILYELLRSAKNLQSADYFYGYLWKIAENTYRDYLRGAAKPTNRTEEFSEDAAVEDSFEDELADRLEREEQLQILRRELSLLTSRYRKATVLYYMSKNSCAEIAKKLHMSVDMVKYCLFRARKILLEGMNMERFYGEKSYRPVNFEIDFWGTNAGSARDYEDFKQRKILGNILLAAYYTPVTMQEISMELGVSMPYLEDEVHILLKRSYLLCLPGNGAGNEKYLANLPIFTVDCTKAIEERLRLLTESTVKRFSAFLNSQEDCFAENFGGRFANENAMRKRNALRWQILMLCMHFALKNTENDLTQRYGALPKGGLYTAIRGGAGIVWGRCVEEQEDREPGAPQDGILGIYAQLAADKRGSVIAMNFRQTINGQHYQGHYLDPISCAGVGCFDDLPEKWKAILENEKYVVDGSPHFPVYSMEEYRSLPTLLREGIDAVTELCRETLDIAAKCTADLAPKHIQQTAEYTGAFVYRFVSLDALADGLYDHGHLLPIADDEKPAMCVIRC